MGRYAPPHPALPPLTVTRSDPDAVALSATSAIAHGSAALDAVSDVAVRYEGQWSFGMDLIQPDLVDGGYRGASEERLLLREQLSAQAYTGPKGRKHVVRRAAPHAQGSVAVWRNGVPDATSDGRAAAALVADNYALFLLGPMLLLRGWAAGRTLVMERAPPERLVLDGAEYYCDCVRVSVVPGMGLSGADRLQLFIDRGERLMRRVRFTLEGLTSTQGAVAQVDTFDHLMMGGVRWPTRFHEQLQRPADKSVHDWRMTGLDLNRGMTAAELSGPALGGAAAEPARPLAG